MLNFERMVIFGRWKSPWPRKGGGEGDFTCFVSTRSETVEMTNIYIYIYIYIYIISNSWFKLFPVTLAVFPNLKLWTDLNNISSHIVRILSTVPKI